MSTDATFNANVKALLTHLLSIGADIAPTKEGKQGFMIWNLGKVKSSIDSQLVENAGYKLLPKPKSFAPDGTVVPARAWLGAVSNRKAATLDELMAKATK